MESSSEKRLLDVILMDKRTHNDLEMNYGIRLGNPMKQKNLSVYFPKC